MIDIKKIMQESSHLSLLYVEDDKTVRESILIILEEFFLNVIVAVDGYDGFEKFQESSVDLIITDINMPRLNGLEMIAKIREIEEAIPILISSAHTESNYFVNSIKLSVDGYLLKPFDMKQFLSALDSVIAKIQLKKFQKKLDHQAHHDYLTGLPNRVLFGDRLRETIKRSDRNKEKFALLFIDLDQFKKINDSLGHEVGDEVLQIVAHRINSIIRKEDTFARLGGDEFTIIMGGLHKVQDASHLAQKILDVLADPIQVNSHSFYISSSIGISLYPQDDEDANNLLKYADTAMYKAKENGRNNFQFYTSEMTEKALEHMTMEVNLRLALQDIEKEFLIYYQPQVNGKSGMLTGVEALIRWQHPSRGLLTPDKFMTIIEETGLIVPLDKWVMKTAMRQIVRWYDRGLNPGVLAINLTMRHLEEESFGNFVLGTMEDTGMKPQWLELEVLESQIMSNPNNAIATLKQLSQLGVELAIDDFGTGYSSLSYLKRLPIDKLKIDKSFVSGLPSEEDIGIIKAIIALSKSLNLEVIAEGVETKEQRKFLIENGCYSMQGYFYGKPMSAEAMEEVLNGSLENQN